MRHPPELARPGSHGGLCADGPAIARRRPLATRRQRQGRLGEEGVELSGESPYPRFGRCRAAWANLGYELRGVWSSPRVGKVRTDWAHRGLELRVACYSPRVGEAWGQTGLELRAECLWPVVGDARASRVRQDLELRDVCLWPGGEARDAWARRELVLRCARIRPVFGEDIAALARRMGPPQQLKPTRTPPLSNSGAAGASDVAQSAAPRIGQFIPARPPARK